MKGTFAIDRGLIGAGVLMLASTLVGAVALGQGEHQVVIGVMLTQGLIYAGAVWLLLRSEREDAPASRSNLIPILATAALMRAMLVPMPPVSTDIYRYVWDGRVQGAGINPYRYRPADPALVGLRDEAIYQGINRVDYARTIYPPMAQAIFFVATRLSENVTAIKLAMLAFEAGAIAVILALLRRRGLPQSRILLYAWHPLPLFEFAGSGHVDAAAIGFMLLAALAADRQHPALAGALLAGGALVKYFPAVIAPALWRRWDWRFPLAFVLVVVALYLPYLGVGRAVLGFLPTYIEEEGLSAGNGFFLVSLIGSIISLPGWSATLYLGCAGLLLAILALRTVFRERRATSDLAAAATLLVVFLIVISPHFPWYFTSAIPFLCFRPSVALIWLTTTAPLLYGIVWSPSPLLINAVLYGPFALLLLLHIRATPGYGFLKDPCDGHGIQREKTG
jgi:hypothetical protein